MVEVYQVAHYFSNRGNDMLALKSAVGVSIFVDTVCTLVDYVLVSIFGMSHSRFKGLLIFELLYMSYQLLITDYGTIYPSFLNLPFS